MITSISIKRLNKMANAAIDAMAQEVPSERYLVRLRGIISGLNITRLRHIPEEAIRRIEEIIRSIVHNIDPRIWRIDAGAADVGRQVGLRLYLRRVRNHLATAVTQLRNGLPRSASINLHNALRELDRAIRLAQ